MCVGGLNNRSPLMYNSDNLGCFSEYKTKMLVKLTNGELVEFSQISDMDCGDIPNGSFFPVSRDEMKDESSYQLILDENLEMLKNYNWVTIRLSVVTIIVI